PCHRDRPRGLKGIGILFLAGECARAGKCVGPCDDSYALPSTGNQKGTPDVGTCGSTPVGSGARRNRFPWIGKTGGSRFPGGTGAYSACFRGGWRKQNRNSPPFGNFRAQSVL